MDSYYQPSVRPSYKIDTAKKIVTNSRTMHRESRRHGYVRTQNTVSNPGKRTNQSRKSNNVRVPTVEVSEKVCSKPTNCSMPNGGFSKPSRSKSKIKSKGRRKDKLVDENWMDYDDEEEEEEEEIDEYDDDEEENVDDRHEISKPELSDFLLEICFP